MKTHAKVHVSKKERFALPDWVHYLVMSLALFSVLLNFNVRVSFTNSGVFMVYASDFLAPFLYLFCFVVFLWKRKTWSRGQVVFVSLFLLFFVFAAGVSIFRFANGQNDAQSLLIPRVNFSSLWVLLYLVLFRPSSRLMLRVMKFFCFVLLVLSVPLALTNHPLAFKLLQSHSIRTLTLLALFPVHLFSVYVDKKKGEGSFFASAFLGLHLLSLIFLVTVSGSRANALFLITFLGVSLLLALLGPRKLRSSLAVLLVLLIGVSGTLYAAGKNGRVAYGISRVPGLHVLANLIPKGNVTEIPEQETPEGGVPDPQVEAEKSAMDSSNARREVWQQAIEDLRQNVFIGPGYRQYSIQYTYVNQREVVMPPHNFILEYSLAYGFLGLAIWLSLMAQPIVLHLPKFKKGRWPWLFSVGLSAFLVFGTAFVQPVLTNPAILLILAYLLGLHHVAFSDRETLVVA